MRYREITNHFWQLYLFPGCKISIVISDFCYNQDTKKAPAILLQVLDF